MEVISNGDSKTIATLNKGQPYGDQVTITKHKCVGHTHKRMAKDLQEAKRELGQENVKGEGCQVEEAEGGV